MWTNIGHSIMFEWGSNQVCDLWIGFSQNRQLIKLKILKNHQETAWKRCRISLENDKIESNLSFFIKNTTRIQFFMKIDSNEKNLKASRKIGRWRPDESHKQQCYLVNGAVKHCTIGKPGPLTQNGKHTRNRYTHT